MPIITNMTAESTEEALRTLREAANADTAAWEAEMEAELLAEQQVDETGEGAP